MRTLAFSLLLLSLSAQATGPSNATVRMTPVATHPINGSVLIKVFEDINPMGANSPKTYRYKWLVVDSKGTWDERLAAKYNENPKSLYASYEKGKIGLQNPDAVLRSLMKQYDFDAKIGLWPSSHRLELKPHQSCMMGRCIKKKSFPQKSTSGIGTVNPVSFKTRSKYYHKGIAIMQNSSNYNFSGATQTGAIFNIPGEKIGKGRSEIEIMNIDAVIFVNEALFRKKK